MNCPPPGWTRCCGVRAGPAARRARASGGEEAGGRRGQPRAAHVRRRDGGGAAAVVEERVELEPDGVDGGLHVPRGGVALGDVLEVEEEGRLKRRALSVVLEIYRRSRN